MNVYIVGAHRTGKSTLAKEIAARKGMEYFPVNLKDCPVWNDYDYSNLESISFKTRIAIQQALLDYYIKQVEGKDNCVFDRSVIDIYTYSLTLQPQTLEDIEIVEKHEQSLIYHLNIEQRDKIILVQPGIEIKETNSVFYSEYKQYQLNYIFIGILNTYFIQKKFHYLESIDITTRINECLRFLN